MAELSGVCAWKNGQFEINFQRTLDSQQAALGQSQ